jgi:DNA repair protein RadC
MFLATLPILPAHLRLITEAALPRDDRQAANPVMAEMGLLEQEHLRTILLDTKNRVVDIPTIYVGSVNTTMIHV